MRTTRSGNQLGSPPNLLIVVAAAPGATISCGSVSKRSRGWLRHNMCVCNDLRVTTVSPNDCWSTGFNTNGGEPEISAAFRRMAANILQHDTTQKESIRGKRLLAGWDENVLEEIYAGFSGT